MVDDYADVGDDLWARFNATPQAIAWYYDEVAQAVCRFRADEPLTRRLRTLADTIEHCAHGKDALDGLAGEKCSDAMAHLQRLAKAKANRAVTDGAPG